MQGLANGPPPRNWEPAAFDTSAWSPPPRAQRPDVYYIILDGFARADVLRDLYDFDAGPFLDGLERREFFVAGRSTSNYSQTRLSLTSSLNADYIDNRDLKYVRDEGPLLEMMAGNRVVKAFRRLGYRLVSFASGYELTELTGADLYLTPFPYMSEFHRLLLRMTPLQHLLPTPAQRDAYINGPRAGALRTRHAARGRQALGPEVRLRARRMPPSSRSSSARTARTWPTAPSELPDGRDRP